MQIFDCHVHLRYEEPTDAARAVSAKAMADAGISGGNIFSPSAPKTPDDPCPVSVEKRVACARQWCKDSPNLFPFLFLDPSAADAIEQVRYAVAQGMFGFKVICNRCYPGDEKCMPVYREIARLGKPLMFHSGILYDGEFSSRFCRPTEFEALLWVPNLRFSIAHLSWPWLDECIALYGKFIHTSARGKAAPAKLYLDNCPGTPPIYRREALAKIFTVGYPAMTERVMFGVDSRYNPYKTQYAKDCIERDNNIYDELHLPDETRERIFHRNLMEFLGVA
jgi:predicted TIM-barrel fold metal-dependent hydrolase